MSHTIASLRNLVPGTAEPGWRELCDALAGVLNGSSADGRPIELDRLKSRVYRLRAGENGTARSLVVKRYDPWLARRNELVLRRWLPALDLSDRAPGLLATAVERGGAWVWHVYEDLAGDPLDPRDPDPLQVEAVVELIATLHTRAAGHAVVPQCRHFCGSLGAGFFAANVRDAIAVLEALAPPRVEPTPAQGELRGRLLDRLYRLRGEIDARSALLEVRGGPDTLLHGDLWTANALVSSDQAGGGGGGGGTRVARLIDWDHAAVGPVSYDVSTFLYRFPKQERSWILELYARALRRAGWRLPSVRDLNAMSETAEYARYANRIIWPAVALLEERAAWGFDQLAEVERWFDALELVLPEP